jgi:hypothetical protein
VPRAGSKEGLFQTPGNLPKIREWVATINSGQDITFKARPPWRLRACQVL